MSLGLTKVALNAAPVSVFESVIQQPGKAVGFFNGNSAGTACLQVTHFTAVCLANGFRAADDSAEKNGPAAEEKNS